MSEHIVNVKLETIINLFENSEIKNI